VLATELAAIPKEVCMNKENKKGRFGIADVFIILLVLLIIGGAAWYFIGDSLFEGGDYVEISYEVRLTNVRSEMIDHIHVGDKVFDGVYNESVGTVSNVSYEAYTEQVLDKNTGELVNAQKDGYYNIYITVNATAERTDNSYFVSDTAVRVGEHMHLHLPDFCGSGYCTSFALVNTEV